MDTPALLLPVLGILVGLTAVVGWILTTWMRVRRGYPLDGFGKPIYPAVHGEAVERIKLLTTENAQLKAEIGSVKDRLETIERIVTDQPSALAREIDSLQISRN